MVKRVAPRGLISLISKRLAILIPVFALLFSFGILQTSLSRTPSGWPYQAWITPNFSYSFNPQERLAEFEGEKIPVPSQVVLSLNKQVKNTQALPAGRLVLGEAKGEEKWIEVDISEQKLIAHEGDKTFLESLVSTGLPGTPTPLGEFRVWYKTKSQKMSGGEGRSYYYLPNVPYIMFFENENVSGYKGYSLHGTYWHDDFGNRRSHGCVNLPTSIAEQLYYWTSPTLSEGKKIARATDDNPGTRIIIHE
ncbi:MAG: hypothetical protein A3F61_01490 [Candidatus Blackburnbacteria bacterium RIFCSPHIGHO2_12_FULL_41_13b]|uniref:L,D-TPase catalytic domain-containing protein n=1 Tax=Candidatus Blackburnbacteria bacterium RIFCSPHIGHO2_12_FULL_41_13b TaxID=1797517 RepID=A0A1G1VBX6_9BACT|nr:MAG: hypothetical protein A3F61_01490 [Candidatus Blackburnbacteria bacterium RIFCSPHIGHO2_12_FULL_41_13b]